MTSELWPGCHSGVGSVLEDGRKEIVKRILILVLGVRRKEPIISLILLLGDGEKELGGWLGTRRWEKRKRYISYDGTGGREKRTHNISYTGILVDKKITTYIFNMGGRELHP